ncbi:hypothetical protein GWI33_003202 [Rhynchophorus ferrugineus]|uniref:Uncharacterized protein n=1 Tax=Rhynchophorus ferrugineus TaxID=354439 RepID=A0A834ITM3_RHYFE|nr:hypothetical protein GWI33_003202 [Rhynchophorus ferrugineus]
MGRTLTPHPPNTAVLLNPPSVPLSPETGPENVIYFVSDVIMTVPFLCRLLLNRPTAPPGSVRHELNETVNFVTWTHRASGSGSSPEDGFHTRPIAAR